MRKATTMSIRPAMPGAPLAGTEREEDRVVDAHRLYAGFDGIGFVEKEPYPHQALARTADGDPIVAIAGDEPFADLAAWPQSPRYQRRWGWRYRPPFAVTQYWRKPGGARGASLQVRVNGRRKYWSGGSRDPADYIDIPGGVAFENFEMRENCYRGQVFRFGIVRGRPERMEVKW